VGSVLRQLPDKFLLRGFFADKPQRRAATAVASSILMLGARAERREEPPAFLPARILMFPSCSRRGASGPLRGAAKQTRQAALNFLGATCQRKPQARTTDRAIRAPKAGAAYFQQEGRSAAEYGAKKQKSYR